MKKLALAFAGGFGAFLALLLAVLATGQTFGQRCAAVYERHTAAHERCVMRASEGGPIHEENAALSPESER